MFLKLESIKQGIDKLRNCCLANLVITMNLSRGEKIEFLYTYAVAQII